MNKKFIMTVLVSAILVISSIYGLYNRYFEYSSKSAHYKIFIDQDPATLHWDSSRDFKVTVHKRLDRLDNVAWLEATVYPESMRKDTNLPHDRKDYMSLDNLKSTNIVDYVKLSKSIVTEKDDVLAKAKCFTDWIVDNIPYESGRINDLIGEVDKDFSDGQQLKTLSVGSAEYATIFAGLMRSQKIPTRLIGGHIFANKKYMTQVWNEVWIEDEGWLSIDVANCRIGADNRYISFYEGPNYDKFIDVLSQMNFGVERMDW